MNEFPSTTKVNRIIPKDALYKNLDIPTKLREKFVSDVQRIRIVNVFNDRSLNVDLGETVKEIDVLLVDLKTQDFDDKIIEAIAKKNPRKLVFLLAFEDQLQLLLYQGKLYKSPWKPNDETVLNIKGTNLDDIWNGFIEQIALIDEPAPSDERGMLSVDERLKRQDVVMKLKRDIEKLDAKCRREKQPARKYEIYKQMQDLKGQLKEIQNG